MSINIRLTAKSTVINGKNFVPYNGKKSSDHATVVAMINSALASQANK